jgi:hypothetical protein
MCGWVLSSVVVAVVVVVVVGGSGIRLRDAVSAL